MKKLESDEPGVMKSTAREMGMSPATAHRLANKFGTKRKAVSVIHLSPDDRKKRRRFAVKHRNADFKAVVWIGELNLS